VQVNANDIATTGATPRWFLATLLLPEHVSTEELTERIFAQISHACAAIGVTVIGGHTEVTHGLERPVLSATMVGEVLPSRLITPRGARSGDCILLSKGVPVEATAILAREFPDRIKELLGEDTLVEAAEFLFTPGISVFRDAQVALSAGRVTAMHDPTEGGLLTALWELSEACGLALHVNLESVPIPKLSAEVCDIFKIDPLGAIASGALLLTAAPDDAVSILRAWESSGIKGAEIGKVGESGPAVWQKTSAGAQIVRNPKRDEIAKLFE
jgi:hydrogenase maturation factor